MGASLSYRRLRAPQEHGGTLIDPPLGAARGVIDDNLAMRQSYSYDMQGRSLSDLTSAARSELLSDALAYTAQYSNVDGESLSPKDANRILLSGHQPDLYHAGVWFKNFVLSSLAENENAAAIHLLIDNDVAGPVSIRVPSGAASRPLVESIAIDRPDGEAPYEERGIVDRDVFTSFASRVAEQIESFIAEPLVGQLWPLALEAAKRSGNLGRSLAEARHRFEATRGLRTLELPLSQVCSQPAFYWFTAHLLAQLPRFRDIYNSALHQYRRQRRIRSHSHPVPALDADDEWLEAPFWIWSAGDPRRRRLFARALVGEIEITDRTQFRARLKLSADSLGQRAATQLADLAAAGIKVRPRALITTMFARLLLCDLFLHGIGGAKYDELTDTIIERFFQLQPPAFYAISATLHLPIDRPDATPDVLRSARRRLRDLQFNPQRYLDLEAAEKSEARRLCDDKQRWIETDLPHGQRLQRHRAMSDINDRLQQFTVDQRQQQAARCDEIAAELRMVRLLGARDFSFCLFSEETLFPFLLELSRAKP